MSHNYSFLSYRESQTVVLNILMCIQKVSKYPKPKDTFYLFDLNGYIVYGFTHSPNKQKIAGYVVGVDMNHLKRP